MTFPLYKVLVTGSSGFIGSNLVAKLRDDCKFHVVTFARDDDVDSLYDLVSTVDAVIHLAGENRPITDDLFQSVNVGLTKNICDTILSVYENTRKKVKLIYSSSVQAVYDNPYGRSKKAAEKLIVELSSSVGNSAIIYRLPGVFGKWSRPNYNSVIATFCHNIARDLPVKLCQPNKPLQLVYIDDLVDSIVSNLSSSSEGLCYSEVKTSYTTTLTEVLRLLNSFRSIDQTLLVDDVGSSFCRALYSTYLSFLPPQYFSCDLATNDDSRGTFAEILKTKSSGQFSFFTSKPGVTRGNHYHHTKNEKFLVVSGEASFVAHHLLTREKYEISLSASSPKVVNSIPGWKHSITNIGRDTLVVLLWSNEVFDPTNPDTFSIVDL